MRVHITLEDDLVARLDRRVGARRRSRFISEAVRRALEDGHRWELIEDALSSIPDEGHDWDSDPAGWVRAQRNAERRRVG